MTLGKAIAAYPMCISDTTYSFSSRQSPCLDRETSWCAWKCSCHRRDLHDQSLHLFWRQTEKQSSIKRSFTDSIRVSSHLLI
jgi:hypothetical protein